MAAPIEKINKWGQHVGFTLPPFETGGGMNSTTHIQNGRKWGQHEYHCPHLKWKEMGVEVFTLPLVFRADSGWTPSDPTYPEF